MTTATTITTKRVRDSNQQKVKASVLGDRSTPFTALTADALISNTADSAMREDSTSTAKTERQQHIDTDMQAVLDAHATLNPKRIENLAYADARKQPTPADAVTLVLKKQGKDWSPTALVPGVISFDVTIPGPAGELPIRVFMPSGVGPFPVVVYFHGGGWVLADKNAYDAGARGIAKQANAVVVSVDYRLAPEAKFPAQHDDALATYSWVCGNAASINGDPKRIAIAGESAGGNLAVATAIAARDRHLTAPLHVLAIYPIAQACDLSTPSYHDSENAKPLNKAMMQWFVDTVFSLRADKTDPRVDLINADLDGLPPVTIINARIDPLRSDADLLTNALKNADVKVEHKVYDGVTHEFFGMAAVVAKAKDAQIFAGKRLQASLCLK
jgi:acetyl esterase